MTKEITEDLIKEKTLLECLEAFQGAEGTTDKEREKSLEPVFKLLAKKFIYGGYLKVGNDYKVFLKTVEFYYHEEEGPVKDNYVYHRNGKFKSSRSEDGHDRTVPYFPLMTLHSHWSGFDITFENPKKKYRASVLIREYAIYDEKERKYVYWDTKKNEYNYTLNDEPIKDNRSSYLIYYLNGFTIQKGQKTRVEWEDTMPKKYGDVDSKTRKGIKWRDPETEKEEDRTKDERKWAFYEK
jgi:hypothetical protein